MTGNRRVFLHVGLPKTGTTYLQGVLARNRARLRDVGMLYPGDRTAHHRAAWDLRGVPAKRAGDQHIAGSWDRLVGEVLDWDGTSVISSELFCYGRPAHVKRVRRALARVELHVVLTVRDLLRQVPAVWQERIKNQHTTSYDDFVEGLLRPELDITMSRAFWGGQDAPAVLGRWATGLPPAHVHVVTVPGTGAEPTELWHRFCAVVGLAAPDGYDLRVPTANVSLPFAQTELLRRITQSYHDLQWRRYRRLVRDRLLPVLADAGSDAPPTGVPATARMALVERSRSMVTELDASGFDIVGSLSDLLPSDAADGSAGPAAQELSDADLVDAAVGVIRRLIEERQAPTDRARPTS